MGNLKLFYFINFVLLVLSFSGCNVAKQPPVTSETNQTASNVVISSSLNKSIYSFNTSLTTVVENATEYSFYLTRDDNALDAQTVLVTVGGDAEATVDWSNFEVNGLPANIYEFDPLVYEVPFKQGEKKVQITVRILEDSLWEKDERLSFSITEHFDYFYDIQSPSLFTIKILNDDDYPQVSFNSTLPSVNEGDSTTVEIQLSNSSDQDVRVPILISGSASSSDHDLTEQVIIIPAGSMSETVEINAASDSIDELDETLILTLTTPMGAELAATNITETVTITDVSLDPELNFKAENDCDTDVAAASIDEDSGSYVLTLCLNTSDYAQSFDVPFVLSGSALKTVDYTLSDNRFRFDPNSTDPNKATIILTTKDDLLYEGNEDITLTISDHAYAVAGADNTITIDITENEAPSVVTLNSGNYQAQEGQTYYLNFSFNNASSTSFTRYLCIDATSTASSDDHTLTDGQEIAIPEGVTSYQHPIFIKNDSLHDSNETLIVSMDDDADCSSPEASQTITIREQGSIPKLEFETVMQEGVEGNNVSVTLKLDRASGRDQTFSVQIQHASSSGADITAETDHTIQEGDTEYAFDIALVADGIDEPSEQFIIKLLQPSDLSLGTKLSQVVTINDNDPASVANLSITSSGSNESDQTADFKVTLDTISTFDITIAFTLTGEASLGEDYTLSANHFFIPAGSTSATITATIIDDDIYDPDEAIKLTLDEGNYYTLGTIEQSVSITEDDDIPEVNYVAAAMSVNENDIATVSFELDRPTYDDVVVTYAVAFSCATPASANDISVNTNFDSDFSTGTFTISEGSTRGVINLNIIADGTYELGTPECFTITVNNTNDTDVATIGSNTTTTVTINDINVAPNISFHPENKFLVATEGVERVLIPIYLSTKVGEDITFLISAREASESAYPADANDFELEVNSTYGTDTKGTGNSGLTTYEDLETIELKIPAGSNMAYLPIALNGASNDDLYEGPEIIELVLENGTGDDSGATYNVDTNIADSDSKARNIFTLEIADDEPYPQVSIYIDSLSSIDGPNATLYSSRSILEEDIQNATPYHVSNTDKREMIVKIEPQHQHLTVNVQIAFSGDAERDTSGWWGYSLGSFNTVDYRVENNGTSVNTLYHTETISPDPANDWAAFHIMRHKDIRYEENETIISTINSAENASIGSNSSATITILNDDNPPQLFISDGYTDSLSGPQGTIDESDYNETITVGVRQEALPGITGAFATEIPVSFDVTYTSTSRLAGSESTFQETLEINSSNSYENEIAITPEHLGDFRWLSSVNLKIDNPSEATLIPRSSLGLPTYSQTSYYTQTVNFSIPDMLINVSKTSKGQEVSGELQHYGHTCMAYRGLVTCFGENNDGQLGRNNTINWGGSGSSDILLQSNTLNLGNHDEYDIPLYAAHLALGRDHTCVAFSNNKIKCWGSNEYAQLGLGLATTEYIGDDAGEVGADLAYVDIGLSSTDSIKGLYAMEFGTCAWLNSGAIKCWGYNNDGQLGINDITDTKIGDSPGEMGSNLEAVKITGEVTLFDTGANHACAVAGGNLKCWGNNTYGQLGVNDSYNRGYDVEIGVAVHDGDVYVSESNISSISAGQYHTCITYDSSAYSTYNTRCWGSNTYGQLGLGRVNVAGYFTNPNYEEYDLTSNWALSSSEGNFIETLGAVSTATDYKEPLQLTGHQNWHDDIRELFGNWDNWVIPMASMYNNQFVQVYRPAEKVESNLTSSCGVYKDYINQGPVPVDEIHIRCWGSNIVHNNHYSYLEVSPMTDTGILNNIGWDKNLDFDPLMPYGNVTFGDSCNDSSGDSSDPCKFMNHMAVIGDEGFYNDDNFTFGNSYLYQDFWDEGNSLMYGFTEDYFWYGGYVNFEMNYDFSKSKTNFTDYEGLDGSEINDIDLFGGGTHMCALPKSDGTDNKFVCWGANWSGQTGMDNSTCKNTGGAECSSGDDAATIKELNYVFPFIQLDLPPFDPPDLGL